MKESRRFLQTVLVQEAEEETNTFKKDLGLFKSKHTHHFMTSITALFNQKHSLNVICVGYFTFNLIRSRPTAPPTD